MDGVIMENLRKSFRNLKAYEWLMAIVMIAIAAWAMISAFMGGSGGGSNPPWLTVINFVSAVCGVFCIFFCASASISLAGLFGLSTETRLSLRRRWRRS